MDFVISILTAIKEVVVTVAASAGVFIAYKGLATWKAQLRATSDHEAAKLVLSKSFAVRKAIHRVRHNWLSPQEFPARSGASKAEKYTHLFKGRWEVLEAALEDLEVAKIQGQALWGKDFEKVFEKLSAAIYELKEATEHYLDFLAQQDSDDEEEISREVRQWMSTIFHVPFLDAAHGSYASKLYWAFKEIEDSVRPHLVDSNGPLRGTAGERKDVR